MSAMLTSVVIPGWIVTLSPEEGRTGPDLEVWCPYGEVETRVADIERIFGYRMRDVAYAERNA